MSDPARLSDDSRSYEGPDIETSMPDDGVDDAGDAAAEGDAQSRPRMPGGMRTDAPKPLLLLLLLVLLVAVGVTASVVGARAGRSRHRETGAIVRRVWRNPALTRARRRSHKALEKATAKVAPRSG